MRPSFIHGFLCFLLLSGCTPAPPPVKQKEDPPPVKQKEDPMLQLSRVPFVIEPAEPAEKATWRFRALRELDGFKAVGVALWASDIMPPLDTPHGVLAGSRAYYLLGQERLGAGDFLRTIAAAKAGIKELGYDYSRYPTLEHTSFTIALAEEAAAKGRLKHAASRILGVLQDRIEMYVTTHAARVRLPPEGPGSGPGEQSQPSPH